MKEMTIGIYVPSYRRSNRILTQHIFEDCTYVVRKTEEEAYRNAGVKKIWAVDDEYIDDGDKVVYYIAENAKEDIIVCADDDIGDMKYLLDDTTSLCRDKERITDEIYRIGQLVYDLRIGLATTPPTCIPYNYDREFVFKGVPGAIKWFNKEVFKAKLDRSVSENFDIDMVMQELLYNRIILIPKYLHDDGVMDVNAGGNSSRKRQDQIDSVTNMKARWGKYFDYDFNKNKPKINVDR